MAVRGGALESVEAMMEQLDFFKGKNVLITGHTGFKGSWLSRILLMAGANVTGYALAPPPEAELFGLSKIAGEMDSVIGDVRDLGMLSRIFRKVKPEIVFHLAAQPIVRESYKDPVYTYDTNVMGTVNICECVRCCPGVKSFVVITTDKVYKNNEWEWPYREDEPLDGFDPYSNSKSCSELVVHGYTNSFFSRMEVAVSTARAGNVIGGGDFAQDRIVPDCVRAALGGEQVIVRNPHSVRPYQHVLEPLFLYLTIARRQWEDPKYAGCYNVGPEDNDCITTGELVELFCQAWGEGMGWVNRSDNGPHEANFLKLDCSRIKKVFGWQPRWHVKEAVERSVEWYQIYRDKGDILACMERQIQAFAGEASWL